MKPTLHKSKENALVKNISGNFKQEIPEESKILVIKETEKDRENPGDMRSGKSLSQESN